MSCRQEDAERKDMTKTTLIIMAAGIGSRFGKGIKQLEKIGPNGEILMDYSIYDAREAGFDKVVFIIRKDIEAEFRSVIGNRIEKDIEVEYVFQELSDIPKGFTVPSDRVKPWGTGHAILCCKKAVETPFVIINADDYYGKTSFKSIHEYLVTEHEKMAPIDLCMAGFILENTLSKNGTVTRGICEVDTHGYLKKVTETVGIGKNANGDIEYPGDEGSVKLLSDSYVSMNMWGGYPDFIEQLEEGFSDFLHRLFEAEKNGRNARKEFLLPVYIDELLRKKQASVKVLETMDRWFGITYKEDKAEVVEEIGKIAADGKYSRLKKNSGQV